MKTVGLCVDQTDSKYAQNSDSKALATAKKVHLALRGAGGLQSVSSPRGQKTATTKRPKSQSLHEFLHDVRRGHINDLILRLEDGLVQSLLQRAFLHVLWRHKLDHIRGLGFDLWHKEWERLSHGYGPEVQTEISSSVLLLICGTKESKTTHSLLHDSSFMAAPLQLVHK